MEQSLIAICWFVGAFVGFSVFTPLMLQPAILHYSEPEQSKFSEQELDFLSIEFAFYRRLFNLNFLIATAVSSALAAYGMMVDEPEKAVAGGVFGVVANAVLGWHVVAMSAPEIAEDFGYVLKHR